MVDGEIGRAQKGCSENGHVVGVDALHTIEQNFTGTTMGTGSALRAGIDNGCALIVDTHIRDDELGVWDTYLKS